MVIHILLEIKKILSEVLLDNKNKAFICIIDY